MIGREIVILYIPFSQVIGVLAKIMVKIARFRKGCLRNLIFTGARYVGRL